jgi:hypothetical protein
MCSFYDPQGDITFMIQAHDGQDFWPPNDHPLLNTFGLVGIHCLPYHSWVMTIDETSNPRFTPQHSNMPVSKVNPKFNATASIL